MVGGPAQKVSKSQLARELGVSRQAVGDLVKRGVLTEDKDGTIDLELARHALVNRVRPSSKTAQALGSPSLARSAATAPLVDEDGDDEIGDYHAAKTIRESAEARIAQLKLAEMRGQVVQKAEVDRAAFEAARALRDGLTNCARRLGATVAVLSTPDECAAAIEREHRTLLQSWARTMGAGESLISEGAAQ